MVLYLDVDGVLDVDETTALLGNRGELLVAGKAARDGGVHEDLTSILSAKDLLVGVEEQGMGTSDIGRGHGGTRLCKVCETRAKGSMLE